MTDSEPNERLTDNGNHRADPSLTEAMEWMIRLRETPNDAHLRDGLNAWLASNPANAGAWSQALRMSKLLGEIDPLTIDEWEEDGQSSTKPPTSPALHTQQVSETGRIASRNTRGRPQRRIAFAAAAVTICLVVALAPWLELRWKADYVTNTAEQREITLADGSTVVLAPESAIATRFTENRRTVRLLAGLAFFDVESDTDRPFEVDARGLVATALGTAFEVSVSDRALSVGVLSGRVGAQYGDDKLNASIDMQLDAGDRIEVDPSTGQTTRSALIPTDIAAWRDGYLFVADASIADVVERIRPYQRGWTIIADDKLAQHRVNGLYNMHDPIGALHAVVQPADGKVTTVTPLITILSVP